MEDARQPVVLDVDRLAARIAQLASDRQLTVVPATPLFAPGSVPLVLLGNNDMSAEDFCGLAAAAGVRLLYFQTKYFDAESEPELNVESDDAGKCVTRGVRQAELRSEAQRFNGRIHQLELAFMVGCTLHCWAVAAEWYGDLLDRAGVLSIEEDVL